MKKKARICLGTAVFSFLLIFANFTFAWDLDGRSPITVYAYSDTLFEIPEYSGEAYAVINDNIPGFDENDFTSDSFETYSELDSLGRCGVAYANIGIDIMPTEERGDISSVYPTGWVQNEYDIVSGGYLYNRCHLIAFELAAENDNEKNLITGTRYFNIEGMLPFENMVTDYVKETEYHVLYRVAPVFEGENLVASGVQMEAESVEDGGEGILFNVFCFNVQPGITIDYATGENYLSEGSEQAQEDIEIQEPETPDAAEEAAENEDETMVWIPNSGTKYHSNKSCSNMKNPTEVSESEAIARGYEPCSKCY